MALCVSPSPRNLSDRIALQTTVKRPRFANAAIEDDLRDARVRRTPRATLCVRVPSVTVAHIASGLRREIAESHRVTCEPIHPSRLRYRVVSAARCNARQSALPRA